MGAGIENGSGAGCGHGVRVGAVKEMGMEIYDNEINIPLFECSRKYILWFRR